MVQLVEARQLPRRIAGTLVPPEAAKSTATKKLVVGHFAGPRRSQVQQLKEPVDAGINSESLSAGTRGGWDSRAP
jgi:hypothetical protein